jgi:hypothetical protein
MEKGEIVVMAKSAIGQIQMWKLRDRRYDRPEMAHYRFDFPHSLIPLLLPTDDR